MPALVRMRRTVGRLRSMPSCSLSNSFEVGVIGALVALRRQLYHCAGLAWRSGVVRTAAPVAVSRCGSATFAVGGQRPPSVARRHAQQLSGIGDGDLVFQDGVEHGESGLFFLVQRNVFHRDIFADQLDDDGIVEQQQNDNQSPRHLSGCGAFQSPLTGQGQSAIGGRWISLMWLGHLPWAGRLWALPVLTALAPSLGYHQQQGRRHNPP